MPRGHYTRKKKIDKPGPRKRRAASPPVPKLLAHMRARRDRLTDEVVELGTAIDALEQLEN